MCLNWFRSVEWFALSKKKNHVIGCEVRKTVNPIKIKIQLHQLNIFRMQIQYDYLYESYGLFDDAV